MIAEAAGLGAGEAAGTYLEGTLDEGNLTSKDAFENEGC